MCRISHTGSAQTFPPPMGRAMDQHGRAFLTVLGALHYALSMSLCQFFLDAGFNSPATTALVE